MRASLVYADKHRMAATAMTHDELLEKLLVTDKTNMTMEVIKWQLALRAVVELHKPQEITLPDGSWGQNCKECDNNWGLCSTIQAIEKELL